MASAYELLRELGHRDVPTYAAKRDADLVVVERYTRVDGEDDDALAPAAHAAEALTELVHPSLAHVREIVALGADVLVVSDFVDGEVYDTLAPAGDAFASVPVSVKLRILTDVLDGLAALHGFARERAADEVSPVHGAVSPDVVVIGLDGRARLVRTCTLFPEQINPASPFLGYMAPELVDGRAPNDPRVDVYGVGVMLWEAITGKRLVVQSNVSSLLLKELDRGPPKGLAAGELVWGKTLVGVVRRALAAPEERFADAQAMADELRAGVAEALAAREEVARVVEAQAGAAIRARRDALGGLAPQLPSTARATIAPKRSERAPAGSSQVDVAEEPGPAEHTSGKHPARARPARPAARVEAGAPRAARARDAVAEPTPAEGIAQGVAEGAAEGVADDRARGRRRSRAAIAFVAGAVAVAALVVGYRLGRHEPSAPASRQDPAAQGAPTAVVAGSESAAAAATADPAASAPPTTEIELVEPSRAGSSGGGGSGVSAPKGRRRAHAPAPPASTPGRFNPQGI